MKKIKPAVKDIIQLIATVTATILSIIGILQSNYSINLVRKSLDTKLSIKANLIQNSYHWEKHPYRTDFSSITGPDLRSWFCFKILIRIDNLSQKDVSIRKITATTILDDKQGYPGGMAPIEEYDNESLGFVSLSDEADLGIKLPVFMKAYEAMDSRGTVCMLLSTTLTSLLNARLFSDGAFYELNTFEEFKSLLIENRIVLDGDCNKSRCLNFGIVDNVQTWRPLRILINVETAENIDSGTMIDFP